MNPNDYYLIRPYDPNKSLPPKESFSQVLNEAFLQPFNWHGRTSRYSYWLSVLVNAVLCLLASAILNFILTPNNLDLGLKWVDGIIVVVIYLICFLAGLGQLIRRLHDVNYDGRWFWLIFTGYGTWFLFYLSLQPSLQKPVKWGSYLFPYQAKAGAYYTQAYQAKAGQKSGSKENMGQILKEHFLQPFNWQARSTRKSYWIGFIFSAVIEVITTFIMLVSLFLTDPAEAPAGLNLDHVLPRNFSAAASIISLIAFILFLWAFLAQLGHAVRRLHDANLNGAWWLIGFLPYIGDILQAFLLFHPTVQRPVKWGGYLFHEKN